MKKKIKNTSELNEIRLAILQLVGAEEMTLLNKSYSTQKIVNERGEEEYKRVYSGKKGIQYKKSDWVNAHNPTRGKTSRKKLRMVLNEISKLVKEAKDINDMLESEGEKKIDKEKYTKNNNPKGFFED